MWKNYFIVVIVNLTFCLGINAQILLGNDIDGEAMNDHSGESISLSGDGLRLAVGAYSNSGNGYWSGHARIYEYVSGDWSQLGTDIDGEAAEDHAGSVSLSDNGSIVAIGAYSNDGSSGIGDDYGHVRVYEYSGGDWVQLGSDIEGEAADDISGFRVSLSGNGMRVAIGAYNNSGNGYWAGHARIYEYNGVNWIQLGSDIDGEAEGDWFGASISLSGDGTRLAVGALLNDGNGDGAGHTRIYEYNGVNWIQLGSDLDGEAAGDLFGASVSLSDDGSRVAIGAYNNSEIAFRAGHARVYQYNGVSWVQLGNDIDGAAILNNFGYSVSLSSDGSRVAIGAVQPGIVQIYDYNNVNWIHVGSDINGEDLADNAGWSVSLSNDGSELAIGAPFNDGSAIDSGHARVYDLSALLSSDSFVLEALSIHPNPTTEVIHLNLKSGYTLEVMNLYNYLGQFIKSTTKSVLDVSNQSSGSYLLEVITDKGKATKKIVVE